MEHASPCATILNVWLPAGSATPLTTSPGLKSGIAFVPSTHTSTVTLGIPCTTLSLALPPALAGPPVPSKPTIMVAARPSPNSFFRISFSFRQWSDACVRTVNARHNSRQALDRTCIGLDCSAGRAPASAAASGRISSPCVDNLDRRPRGGGAHLYRLDDAWDPDPDDPLVGAALRLPDAGTHRWAPPALHGRRDRPIARRAGPDHAWRSGQRGH